jgi:predicted site-specific integrase-resolvase
MATAILCAPRASVEFVRVQHAARLLGVCVQTIRNYADDPANHVEVRRTPGNHRLLNLAQIAECFGIDLSTDEDAPARASEEEVRQGKLSVCYSRVSTRSQCVDKNLDRQAERLRSYVAANHSGTECIDVSEQASGINSERKGLTKIIDLALTGRLQTLFIETEDRLSRGSYALIARLLAKCGVEIVVTRTGERESTAKTAEEEIFHDAMAMIYVGQSRLYGKRASLGKRFIPSQALRDRIAGLYGQGIPAGKIYELLREENHRCQGTGKSLSPRIVWKLTQEIDRANHGKRVPESVRRFVQEARGLPIGDGAHTGRLAGIPGVLRPTRVAGCKPQQIAGVHSGCGPDSPHVQGEPSRHRLGNLWAGSTVLTTTFPA